MSLRAGWRLETLGFKGVPDYMDGKADWMAAGLPMEGTNAERPQAADVSRKDAVIRGAFGRRQRAGRRRGWEAAVVGNEETVVLGLLRKKELAGDPGQPVKHAMRPGPSTFRPYVAIAEMAAFMVDHSLDSSPITTSDGRLVGLLFKVDAVRVAHGVHHGHESEDKGS